METKLSTREMQKLFEGEGGCYYSWTNAVFPTLSEFKLGGGKLVLHPLGFALPHYADCSKVAYVLQGTGRVGVLLPTASEEKVLRLKKGDIIPFPRGAVSWWYNDGDADFSVVFLGETSKAHNPGEFTYFFLAGPIGVLNSLSTELLGKAFNLEEEDAKKIVTNQTGVLIVKLEKSQIMPEPCKGGVENFVINADVKVEKSRRRMVMTSEELALLGRAGLSTINVKLHGNAIYGPEFLTDSVFQMIYLVKGSGRFQIAGMDGKVVLDETAEAGQLFVVPHFFVVLGIAGDEGMEWFSIITSQKPAFGQLAGKTSVWKALSPHVVQASLNISPQLEERFRNGSGK